MLSPLASPASRRRASLAAAIEAPTTRLIIYWRLVPTVGYRYALPEISRGSFFVAAVRYDFNFTGTMSSAPPTNSDPIDAFATPSLNIALPHASFLTLYPSTDIRTGTRKPLGDTPASGAA